MVDCSGRCAFLVVLAVAAAALSGLGCPSTRQLAVSTTSHDFGLSEAPWTFKVWNADTSGSILNFDLATNVSWITCTPTSGASTGPADRETITVTVDRTGLAVGEHRGVITISGRGALYAQVIIYATLADDIAVSHTSYDFEESQLPWAFEVWNADTDGSTLSFEIERNAAWIVCNPSSGTSTGPSDRKAITVTANRTGLAAGTHSGAVTISASGMVSKTISVSVSSSGNGAVVGSLNIEDVTSHYSAPYLLDFTFSLRDADDHAVVADPAAFEIVCMEDGDPISASETGAHAAKAANKQLKCVLVLDYTRSMADPSNGDDDGDGISNAIEYMEQAAKESFLDSLSDGAQVGIYEFHRRDREPQKVADFTADKAYLKARIDAIWDEYVQGFPEVSRCWDAVYAAVQEFALGNPGDESRYVVFLSDGRDESSVHTYHDIVDAAIDLGVRIYCIGFGAELDLTTLQVITTQTNGAYYSADAVTDLEEQFAQIGYDLQGQYTLRWATLKQGDTPFEPSFTITYDGKSATYTEADNLYRPSDYAGDTLQGVLRLVPSQGVDTTTVFVRTTYVPYYIREIWLYIESAYAFDVSLVAAADGGLCADWTLVVQNDAELPGKWVEIESPDPTNIFSSIPYAVFGPILRFDFADLIEDETAIFDAVAVDNDVYNAVGQSFIIEGWEEQPPE